MRLQEIAVCRDARGEAFLEMAEDAESRVGIEACAGETVDGLDGRVGSQFGYDVSAERASGTGDGLVRVSDLTVCK